MKSEKSDPIKIDGTITYCEDCYGISVEPGTLIYNAGN